MKRPVRIEKEKLVLTEGADACFFMIWAYQAFGCIDIQVLDFGGINDLGKYLEMLRLLPNFDQVTFLAITRDSEKDSHAAISIIKSALANSGFAVPSEPFQFEQGNPRTVFMLFPGWKTDSTHYANGTLEDLCLSLVEGDDIIECVDEYIYCVEAKIGRLSHPHKSKLHTYLAATKYVGMKIGESAKAEAWDWEHTNLAEYKSSEGGPCYANGTCDGTLVCNSDNICEKAKTEQLYDDFENGVIDTNLWSSVYKKTNTTVAGLILADIWHSPTVLQNIEKSHYENTTS